MIKSESITEVKDAMRIDDVINRCGVELKKRGAGLIACCPFHTESTPSFNVNTAKGFYKCFGCGKSGDAITFLMEYEHLDFIAAVTKIGTYYNIRVQAEKMDVDMQELEKELLELRGISKACARQYQKKLLEQIETHSNAAYYLTNDRKFSKDSIIQWQLGFAPDEWRFITPMIVEKGLLKPAESLGIVKTKNDSNYDVFRNRIIFPIHDVYGNVVAFGGRTLLSKEEQKETDTPKYWNSQESKLFSKGKVLYGLYFAFQSIRKNKYAILVEGYTDVISFHQHGADNTIASCGTALTEDHCKQLRKYTDHIIVCRDGDAAGTKATMRDIDLLLKYGFKAEVLPLPEGEDPDSFAQQFHIEEEKEDQVAA